MQIISISGLDGSGKSTQIEMLKSYLESQGKKVFYFHSVQFSIGKLGKGTVSTSGNKSVEKANWFQIQLRKIAFGIDLCRFGKLLKKLEKQNYDYLISDRYFYDTVINIKYLENKLCHSRPLRQSSSEASENGNPETKKFPGSPIESGMTKKIPSPDVAIYLQTDPEIIMQRERKPDQGIEYLKKKKELLDEAASLWNLKVIDGNRNKEEVFEEIKKISNSSNF